MAFYKHIQQTFAERAGKAHREPHRRSQGNEARTKQEQSIKKGRNWIPIISRAEKKGVAKCDTLLLIFEQKFPCLSYGQICPKLNLFQLGQKCPGSASGQKCLIALLFALCSKKSVTGDQKRFPDLESKNALTPYFTVDKKVHHLQKSDNRQFL